jgi:hypothetical protein
VTSELPNGCTVKASPYVTSPSVLPGALYGRSARMPPGFMKAICAPPRPASSVAASCASAITSPSADSPAGVLARVSVAVILPMTRLRGPSASAA